MDRFCPKCGKESSLFIGNFCKECYLEDHKLVTIDEEFPIERCKYCEKLKLKFAWCEYSSLVLQKFIEDKIKTVILSPQAHIEFQSLDDDEKVARITVVGTVEGKIIEVKKSTILKFLKAQCDACMKVRSNYWEAILQLRPKVGEKILKWDKFVKKVEAQLKRQSGDGLAKIVTISKNKRGIDIYLGSSMAARKIADTLSREFKSDVVYSNKA
ncbi:MAG: NMD3-related protein, partial [Candidatus Diapherotrites archaeon]|nr:NMD3-related protein [Candidatus Diapherotrites archaeon]